jgi:hypothetical protein
MGSSEVTKTYGRMFLKFAEYLSWSQIWLNFPMDYQHFGYITKIGTVMDSCGMQRISFTSEISPKNEIKQIKFGKEMIL